MTNTDGKRTKYLPIILLALIILLLSSYMVYWGAQKEGYFIDEIFSVMNIRGGGLDRPYFYDEFWDTWHVAADLESTVGVTSENAFTYIGQSKSLYWTLLHIAYSLRPDELSAWPSVVLNILTLAVIQIVMYKLSQFFIENKYLALLPGFIWGISSAAINLVVFIRVYLFMTLFCLLLLYFVLTAIKRGFAKWRILFVIPIAATAYFGAYLHQYFLVFAFSMSVCVGLYLLITRQFKSLLILVGAIGIPILLGYGAIQQFLGFFRAADFTGDYSGGGGSGRGAQAVENLVLGNDGFFDRVMLYFNTISNTIFANISIYVIFGIFIAFALIIFTDKERKCTKTANATATVPLLLIGGICILYLLIIARIAPYQDFRYIACITPLIIILFISLAVNALKTVGFKRVVTVFAIVSIPCSILLSSNIEVPYLFRDDINDKQILSEYYHLPVIRFCRELHWASFVYWWYFEFEDKIIFIRGDDESMELIGEATYENGVLFIAGDRWDNPGIESILEATGLSNYTLLPTNTGYHHPPIYYLTP